IPRPYRGKIGSGAFTTKNRRSLPPYVQPLFGVIVVGGNRWPRAPDIVHFNISYLLRMTSDASFPDVNAQPPLLRLCERAGSRQRRIRLLHRGGGRYRDEYTQRHKADE